ncbi:MAG TPA: hypothetical protein VHC44_16275 [Verrucomicrobiae bacterium]|nr:hypothetical protein [Verrucomicrobiae bacterium]
MIGRKSFLGAMLIVALAIIAALWGMQLEANRRLREEAANSRQLLSRLAVLEVDDLRLSNIVAQANTPLADEQLAELSKLREEVQKLRLRTNDIQTLRTELRRLRVQLINVRMAATSNAPPDVPAGDIYPRESWKFAGYDTPEDAIESVTWAISQGDEENYLASLSPELQDEMESQIADGNFADLGPSEMEGASGYRVLDRETVSDTERIITLYMDGDGNIVPLTLVLTADGWRVSGQETGN